MTHIDRSIDSIIPVLSPASVASVEEGTPTETAEETVEEPAEVVAIAEPSASEEEPAEPVVVAAVETEAEVAEEEPTVAAAREVVADPGEPSACSGVVRVIFPVEAFVAVVGSFTIVSEMLPCL